MKIAAGDTGRWKWHCWDFEADYKVLEVVDNQLLRFDFGESGVVSLRFEETELGTLITLDQENIPLNERARVNYFYGCSLGWSFWLVNLKAWLEHGILLNETPLNFQEGIPDIVNC